jgi:hypothetical protein
MRVGHRPDREHAGLIQTSVKRAGRLGQARQQVPPVAVLDAARAGRAASRSSGSGLPSSASPHGGPRHPAPRRVARARSELVDRSHERAGARGDPGGMLPVAASILMFLPTESQGANEEVITVATTLTWRGALG